MSKRAFCYEFSIISLKKLSLVKILPKLFSKGFFFRLHAWVGIIFGPLLYVICLSGSIAVLSNEIDWLLNPKIKSQPGKINWDLVYSKFNESYPNYELTTVRAPRHSGFAAQGYAKSENGKTLRVYSNPVSGEVQTLENFWNTQRFFRSFHRRFFILPGKVGILFVSLYAIPLIILVILGVRVQGKKIIKLIYNVRKTKNQKKLFSNYHLLLSNWSWIFAVVISLTGIWYGVETFKPASSQSNNEIHNLKSEINTYDKVENKINFLCGLSLNFIDSFTINSIRFDAKSDLITIQGKTSGIGTFFRSRANSVTFNFKTGKFVRVYRSVNDTKHKIISDIADPIHFGNWGGLVTQIIWFLLGLMLSIAIMFGLILSTKRISAKYHPSKYSFNLSIIILLLVIGYSLYGGFLEYSSNVDAAVILPKRYIFFVIILFVIILTASLGILLKSIHSTLCKN
tara:strand:- start:4864 stop:6228 length:1365 start_codon:yes stop_codon:yes gene_type:complete